MTYYTEYLSLSIHFTNLAIHTHASKHTQKEYKIYTYTMSFLEMCVWKMPHHLIVKMWLIVYDNITSVTIYMWISFKTYTQVNIYMRESEIDRQTDREACVCALVRVCACVFSDFVLIWHQLTQNSNQDRKSNYIIQKCHGLNNSFVSNAIVREFCLPPLGCLSVCLFLSLSLSPSLSLSLYIYIYIYEVCVV